MASKRQYLDINKNISDNCLNIKKKSKNSYKKLKPNFNEKISENSELRPIFNKKIGENLYKELRPTFTKKIGKSLNKKLRPSFIYKNIYLKKKNCNINYKNK